MELDKTYGYIWCQKQPRIYRLLNTGLKKFYSIGYRTVYIKVDGCQTCRSLKASAWFFAKKTTMFLAADPQ